MKIPVETVKKKSQYNQCITVFDLVPLMVYLYLLSSQYEKYQPYLLLWYDIDHFANNTTIQFLLDEVSVNLNRP